MFPLVRKQDIFKTLSNPYHCPLTIQEHKHSWCGWLPPVMYKGCEGGNSIQSDLPSSPYPQFSIVSKVSQSSPAVLTFPTQQFDNRRVSIVRVELHVPIEWSFWKGFVDFEWNKYLPGNLIVTHQECTISNNAVAFWCFVFKFLVDSLSNKRVVPTTKTVCAAANNLPWNSNCEPQLSEVRWTQTFWVEYNDQANKVAVEPPVIHCIFDLNITWDLARQF